MAIDTKSIKNRIKSIDSTLHITKAMELVASSKIKKAAIAAENSGNYAESMLNAMKDVISPDSKSSIYISPYKSDKSCIILIAGDRGLAGGYNLNVMKLLKEETSYKKAVVLPIGNRAVEYCLRHNYDILSSEFRTSEKITDSDVKDISEKLNSMYKNKEFDSIKIIWTKPENVLSQIPVCSVILPFKAPKKIVSQIIFEPDCMTLLDSIIPDYLTAMICSALRNSFLAELYSRRNSMDSATKNAVDMIEKLTLQFNRARQGSITQEITEIVAGSENQ